MEEENELNLESEEVKEEYIYENHLECAIDKIFWGGE